LSSRPFRQQSHRTTVRFRLFGRSSMTTLSSFILTQFLLFESTYYPLWFCRFRQSVSSFLFSIFFFFNFLFFFRISNPPVVAFSISRQSIQFFRLLRLFADPQKALQDVYYSKYFLKLDFEFLAPASFLKFRLTP